jgi:hypothetical protein
VFCDACGNRIVVGVGDSWVEEGPYVVWRFPFAFLETITLTRFQFFFRLGLAMVMAIIGLPAVWVIGLHSFAVLILAVLVGAWLIWWTAGRRAAIEESQRRDR